MTAVRCLAIILGTLVITTAAHATGDPKRDVTLFYEAFTKRQPSLFERIVDASWMDIPPAPNQSPGPAGARELFAELTGAFPDLEVRVEDVLRDGDKVIVRSTISGTQRGAFAGTAPRNRRMSIQAIDIHEFRNGKIVRTWHTEDWMSGLHQLGAFER